MVSERITGIGVCWIDDKTAGALSVSSYVRYDILPTHVFFGLLSDMMRILYRVKRLDCLVE